MDDFLVTLVIVLLVGNVPAEGYEERVEELTPQFGFVFVVALLVLVFFKTFDKAADGVRCGHGQNPIGMVG
jgi:hypothetical protein